MKHRLCDSKGVVQIFLRKVIFKVPKQNHLLNHFTLTNPFKLVTTSFQVFIIFTSAINTKISDVKPIIG